MTCVCAANDECLAAPWSSFGHSVQRCPSVRWPASRPGAPDAAAAVVRRWNRGVHDPVWRRLVVNPRCSVSSSSSSSASVWCTSRQRGSSTPSSVNGSFQQIFASHASQVGPPSRLRIESLCVYYIPWAAGGQQLRYRSVNTQCFSQRQNKSSHFLQEFIQ